jgi:hypothetical protein
VEADCYCMVQFNKRKQTTPATSQRPKTEQTMPSVQDWSSTGTPVYGISMDDRLSNIKSKISTVDALLPVLPSAPTNVAAATTVATGTVTATDTDSQPASAQN